MMKNILNSFYKISILILNDINLISLMYRYYKWSALADTITSILDFVWWILLLDNGSLTAEKIGPLAIGYFIWFYAYLFIWDTTYFISESSQTGVLEQLFLNPNPFYSKLIIRYIANIPFWTLQNLLILLTLVAITGAYIPFNLASLLVFIITIFGIVGFSLIIAGVGIIFKKTQSFAYLITNILLFLNGSILPIENMPFWLRQISRSLPSTQGIIVIRELIFNNKTLLDCLYDTSLIFLIFNSFIYLALGLIVFMLCQKWVQNKGIIGHY